MGTATGGDESPGAGLRLDIGRRTALDRLSNARLHSQLVTTCETPDQYGSSAEYLRENQDTVGDDLADTFIVGSRVVEHRTMSVGKRKFSRYTGAIDDDTLQEADFMKCQDCAIEYRDPDRIYNMERGRAPVGLFVKIPNQRLSSLDKTLYKEGHIYPGPLFEEHTPTLVVSRINGGDSKHSAKAALSQIGEADRIPYPFSPTFDMRPWNAGDLGPETLISLDESNLASLLPVSVKSCLKQLSVRSNARTWITWP